ncbi:MAG: helix-turn-helix domain-containing protein [Chloroflexi bacterium]|nr:helix-turn-helix domain-containing protein [Chloroflexota bacterium]
MAGERFLTLADVAEVLNISASQTYALVRTKQLKAIKIGGRGQYRVEREQLEKYIARMYEETDQYLDAHPFAEIEGVDDVASGTQSNDVPEATG